MSHFIEVIVASKCVVYKKVSHCVTDLRVQQSMNTQEFRNILNNDSRSDLSKELCPLTDTSKQTSPDRCDLTDGSDSKTPAAESSEENVTDTRCECSVM